MTIPFNSWLHRRTELEAFAQSLDKSAKLATKRGRVWGLSRALKTFATTIGRTVYVPEDWTYSQVRQVLPHEVLGHVKQFRWCGLGIHPTLGIFPGMCVLYLLLFFPVLLAWGRYRLELHAETKSWMYHLTQENSSSTRAWVKLRAESFPKKVGGKAYLYAVPQKWAVWGFNRRARRVLSGFQGTIT